MSDGGDNSRSASASQPATPRKSAKKNGGTNTKLTPYESNADIMNPSYKLLSDQRRIPSAVMSGKGANYGGGALSLDGTIMSSNPNPLNGTVTSSVGGGMGSLSATRNSKAGGEAASADGGDGGSRPTSSRRVPQPPGPGAYVMPSLWTPTKGAGRWRPELYPEQATYYTNSPSRHSPRSGRGMATSGVDTTDVLYLPPAPKGKSFSMSSRWDGQVPKHAQLPGPGSYDSFTSAFSPTKHKGKCSFGMRPPPLKSPRAAFPGPGTYEVGTETPHERMSANGASYRTTAMAGKWVDPTPPRAPHALSYVVPAHFDKTPTGGVTTIKGRLAHPMDSKDIAMEPAQTDRPRDQSRRIKMRPVA